MRRLSILTPLLIGACLSIAGCGSHTGNSGIASAGGGTARSSATPRPTTSVDTQQQMLDFARCMRAHGVNMDDPQANGGGIRIQAPQSIDQNKMQAATKACQQYLPNGGQLASLSPQQVEAMRKYAQCMRDHGVDMPDPDTNGALRINGVKADDPTFKAAQDACRALQPGRTR
ncbi:MAG TPA: hypothetical protein VJT31_13355 [Rugosimonospora sp.]|nr:hypothetical protein [Rugosimonospora sp.]